MITSLACLADAGVIESSYRIACFGAVIAALIALLLFVLEWRRRGFVWWPLYGALVLVHPGWPLWPIYRSGILAVSSDCGYSDRFFSVAVVLVLIGTLAIRVFRPDFRLRLYLVVLASVPAPVDTATQCASREYLQFRGSDCVHDGGRIQTSSLQLSSDSRLYSPVQTMAASPV